MNATNFIDKKMLLGAKCLRFREHFSRLSRLLPCSGCDCPQAMAAANADDIKQTRSFFTEAPCY